MMKYKYRPILFFTLVYLFTWAMWGAAYFLDRAGNPNAGLALMILGLVVPSATALIMVLTSKSQALKKDYIAKITDIKKIDPVNVILAVASMFAIIMVSIAISLLFGQSTEQFSFVNGFSFSIGGIPTLFTLVLTALLEEFGWRGYAEDSIASYTSWFKESIIFGIVWGLWHLPLFFIPGTYQNNIMNMNIWYMVNFLISVIPIGFLFTWVYVKNKRSIFACAIFHFFVNFLQEEIAMTQVTKCIETFVILAVAVIIVLLNKEMFFEKRHVGHLLDQQQNSTLNVKLRI